MNPYIPAAYSYPMVDEYNRAAIRVDEKYQKAEIDLIKAELWLETATNIKAELQTQRVLLHFDENRKSFHAMIPQIRAGSTNSSYKLRELFDAEGFDSETWLLNGALVKLKISLAKKISGQVVSFTLCEKECSGNGIRKALKKEGVVMKISQQYEAVMYEDILCCLIAHASKKHILFPHLGWNQIDGKWIFSSKTDEEVTVGGDPNTAQTGCLGIENTFKGKNLQIFFEGILGYILHQELLKAMGLRLQVPVAIIYDTVRTAEEVKRFLSTFIPVKEADSYLTPKKLGRIAEKSHSEPIYYEAGTGRYNDEDIHLLCSWARSGQVHGMIADGFPILFFSGWLPDQWWGKVLTVNVCEEDISFSTFCYTEKAWVKALSSFSPQFIDQVCKDAKDTFNEINGNLKVLLVSYFINTCFFRQPIESELCNAYDGIDRILETSENTTLSGIGEMFKDCLYEWVTETQCCDCYQRTQNFEDTKFRESILYDEKFIYLPESIFNKVIGPIRSQASSLEIKRFLRDEGVIVCQNSEGYTINLLLKQPKAILKRRFFRIDRQTIARPGELDIIALCENFKNTYGG